MKEYCSLHPTTLAHWRCPKCHSTYCNECISVRKGGPLLKEDLQFCSKCNVEAKWVGAANLIDPFWHRMPKFFTYPLHIQPLLLIVILSLVGVLFAKPTLINSLFRMLLWGILFKYAFSALTATAKGDLAPPKISAETISENFHQVYKQIFLIFILGALFVVISLFLTPIVGLLFLIFVAFFFPAMVILLVSTSSLLHALNPVIFTKLAFRIGKGYFLMYFFLILLYIVAPAFVSQFLIKYIPAGLYLFLIGVASNYYTVVCYHLMGYVILQYHEEVGYEVDYENFRDPSLGQGRPEESQTGGADPRIINQVNILVTEGKLDEAVKFIQAQTAESGIQDLTLSERYFNLLKLTKRKAELLKHSVTHLHLLSEANQKIKTCQLYAKCLNLNSQFLPKAATLFKIGGWLNETGKTQAALGTYNRLIKAYPNDALVPKAYFRSAQIFNDRMMKPDKAKKILKGIIQKYPNHDIIVQAKAYLSHI